MAPTSKTTKQTKPSNPKATLRTRAKKSVAQTKQKADPSPQRQSLIKHYCWTLNNYTPEELAQISLLVDDPTNDLTYICYGKEKASVPHLQGYLESSKKGIYNFGSIPFLLPRTLEPWIQN